MAVQVQPLKPPQQVQRTPLNTNLVLWTLFGSLFSIALGALLWLGGAYFTSVALAEMLKWWNVPYPMTGWAWVRIPFAFSVVEVVAVKFRKALPAPLLWFAAFIGLVDFATSVYGVALVLGGKHIPMMSGFDIPPMNDGAGNTSPVPVLVGMLVSAVLTFGPEHVVLSGFTQIWKIAKLVYLYWKGR